MSAGKPALALVLHAHLPFVRHPEHADFLEERWLFEALVGCYVPMLWVLDGWERDRLDGVVTLSVSPTLAAMLEDGLLRFRFRQHLERLETWTALEEERQLLDPAKQAVARFHRGRFGRVRRTWEALGGDVLGGWRRHAEAGRLELITCSATHAVLPLLVDQPRALRAQIRTGLDEHARHFGRRPEGFWLPECAWTPAIEAELLRAGVGWTVVETHGLLGAQPASRWGVFGPIVTPGGLTVYGRDPSSARQVWSRHGGYPGDGRYREFHSDAADDAEWGHVAPYTAGTGARVPTGLKYHRVTGGAGEKEAYDPIEAQRAVREHARHFVLERRRGFELAGMGDEGQAMAVAPYDAELFGHWWFEGMDFVDAVVREGVQPGSGLRLSTPGRHRRETGGWTEATPCESTWGEGGHLAMWLDESNAWVQRSLRRMATRMRDGVAQGTGGDPVRERVLRQAGREWLLAQGSDWPFLIRTRTAGEYALGRFRSHEARFGRLAAMWEGRERVDKAWLAGVETVDNLFPELDMKGWEGLG